MLAAMQNPYETDAMLNEYLLMHYGSHKDVMPWAFGPSDGLNFTSRTVAHFPSLSGESCERALDLGCAVGGSSFTLSCDSEETIGLDFSQQFIDAAETIRTQGEHPYHVQETGKTSRPAIATLPDGARPDRVKFMQGDATNLPEDLGSFCRVHAANLLCRLPEPIKLLDRLPSLVRPGGHLVLATPCTWLEDYTAPEQQPDGDTFEWMKQQLAGDFKLISQHDEPFIIRETARKFQWSVSLLTVWQRD